MKLKAPVFGPLFQKVALARMASTFGMLLQAALLDHRFPHFARRLAEVGHEQITQRRHCSIVKR